MLGEIVGIEPEALAKECLYRVLEEPHERRELHGRPFDRREDLRQESGARVASCRHRSCPGQLSLVEPPRAPDAELARSEIDRVERLEGVLDDNRFTRRACSVFEADSPVHYVQQFGYGHRRRTALVQVLVAPLEGDNQVLSSRQERIEEELPVLSWDVAVPDLGASQQ